MCGIAGMYLYKRGNLQEDYFSWCLSTMKRRGPDSQKTWHNNENYITAFARLAIRDLSEHGDQPMLSDCKNYCISFNGEIYNTNKLKEKLRPYRSCFQSTSDTEVFLYALMHLGVDSTLSLADGMFAFAFFDTKKNKLILARDRMGIKPLYVGTSSKGIVYSSQYDHIINHSFFKDESCNETAIASYLFLGYMAENSGIINNTYLVPHGYYIVAENGRFNTHNYYDYPIKENNEARTFDEVLRASVDEQLVSDVPVGTFMSGGVDSNLVTYFANHHHTNFQAFTIGVSDDKMNEAEQAKIFAGIFQTDHYCKYITRNDLVELIKENTLAFTEPFADHSSLPTLALSKFAKEKITVALSGDGGDELFWGYQRNINALHHIALYRKNLLSRRVSLLVKKFKQPSSIDVSRHWSYKNFIDYYYSSLSITGAIHWLPQIYKAEPEKVFFFCNSMQLFDEIMDTKALMNVVRKMEMDIHLQRILLKVDRASMHYSLETRVPFLSNAMLDYSLCCTYDECIKDTHGKIILKNSLAQKTEASLVFQAKKGFTVPLNKWIRKEIKKDVTEKIMDMPAHLSVFFRSNQLERLLKEHAEKKHCDGWLIWAIYSLVNWDITHRNKYQHCV
jgi:asparagine synthase (glutamine-hydrolysing)